MPNPLRVIAGCTHRSGLLNQYEQQLGAAGIPLCLEVDPSYKYPQGWRMIGDHVDRLQHYLDKYGDCENIIFTDAWDVLFYGTAEDVAAKVPNQGVLCGAERNCWPDAYLVDAYPGSTAHKYLNGGLIAAKPDQLAAWLQAIRTHPAFHHAYMDQQWLNQRVLDRTPLLPQKLDTDTALFYCMFKERGEMEFRDGRPTNTANNSQPNFIHFNGNSGHQLWAKVEMAAKSGIRALIIDEYQPGQQTRGVHLGARTADELKRLETLLELSNV